MSDKKPEDAPGSISGEAGAGVPADSDEAQADAMAAAAASVPFGVLPDTPTVLVVNKSWGSEAWWAFTDHYCGKKIYVNAGCRLSKQYHERKTETMLCERGEGILEVNGIAVKFTPGMVQYIPAGVVHRLTAITAMVILETSTTEVDDVVRLEDDYGRAGTCQADSAPGGDPGREGGSGRLNGGKEES